MTVLWEGTMDSKLLRLVLISPDTEDASYLIVEQVRDNFKNIFWKEIKDITMKRQVLIEFMKVARNYTPVPKSSI